MLIYGLVLGSVILFILNKKFRPFIAWRWASVQVNAGLDPSKLDDYTKSLHIGGYQLCLDHNTTTEDQMLNLLFLIYSKHQIPVQSVVNNNQLTNTVKYLTRKLDEREEFHELGYQYIAQLVTVLGMKMENSKSESESLATTLHISSLHTYLLKNYAEYKLLALVENTKRNASS